MQPNPRADTSRPLPPNVRFCIFNVSLSLVQLDSEACKARSRHKSRGRPDDGGVVPDSVRFDRVTLWGMATRRIVVIGASSGGIEAMRTLFAALPQDFVVPICLVVHISPEAPGLLASMLGRKSLLPVTTAADGEQLLAGHVYVAPPDRHLLIEAGRMRVTRGPKENRFRPA